MKRLFSVIAAIAIAMTFALPVSASDLYVKGLVMVDLTGQDVRLCLPAASNHEPTLTVVRNGLRQSSTIKGNGRLISVSSIGNGSLALPAELIKMSEIYGKVSTDLSNCPSVISIPKGAIHSISTSKVSKAHYGFVRVDNGQPIQSFRPRQVAEEIKIELDSNGVLAINNRHIPLNQTELRLEYVPSHSTEADPFVNHFHSYLAYLTGQRFDVVPRNLDGATLQSISLLDNIVFCYLIAVQ